MKNKMYISCIDDNYLRYRQKGNSSSFFFSLASLPRSGQTGMDAVLEMCSQSLTGFYDLLVANPKYKWLEMGNNSLYDITQRGFIRVGDIINYNNISEETVDENVHKVREINKKYFEDMANVGTYYLIDGTPSKGFIIGHQIPSSNSFMYYIYKRDEFAGSIAFSWLASGDMVEWFGYVEATPTNIKKCTSLKDFNPPLNDTRMRRKKYE